MQTFLGWGQEDHIISKEQDIYQYLLDEAPITILNILMKKGLQIIDIDPKQGGGQGAALLKPNGNPDEIWNSMSRAKTTKDWLIKARDGNQ